MWQSEENAIERLPLYPYHTKIQTASSYISAESAAAKASLLCKATGVYLQKLFTPSALNAREVKVPFLFFLTDTYIP